MVFVWFCEQVSIVEVEFWYGGYRNTSKIVISCVFF